MCANIRLFIHNSGGLVGVHARRFAAIAVIATAAMAAIVAPSAQYSNRVANKFVKLLFSSATAPQRHCGCAK